MQEFVSHIGRRLGLRSYVTHPLDQALCRRKYLLRATMLGTVWISGLTLLSLTAALFHYRFWCRYLCPLGAFLALSNRIALFQRWVPQRCFDHCDLGVRGERDPGCICCQRCLTGRDTGVRRGGE